MHLSQKQVLKFFWRMVLLPFLQPPPDWGREQPLSRRLPPSQRLLTLDLYPLHSKILDPPLRLLKNVVLYFGTPDVS